jgi:hypothetical protein
LRIAERISSLHRSRAAARAFVVYVRIFELHALEQRVGSHDYLRRDVFAGSERKRLRGKRYGRHM